MIRICLGALAIVRKPYEMDALVSALESINKEGKDNLKVKPIII